MSAGVPAGASRPNHELASKPGHRAGLGNRGQVGQGGAALGAGHGQGLELAGLDLRHGRGQVVEHQVHGAADQVEQRRAGAAVGEVDHEGAGARLEELARQVDRGAVAAGRHVQLARVGLGITDQVGHGIDLQRFGLGRVHHQHVGHTGHQRDRREVLDRVIGQLGIERGIDAMRAHGAHQQGVAVGCRLGHLGRADVAASAGLVVDQEGLAKGLAEFGRQRARQDVGGAARGKGHHDAHGLVGPGGLGLGQARQQGGAGQGKQVAAGEIGHGNSCETA